MADPRLFDDCFQNLPPWEREALVWHLAMYRAHKTVETLLRRSIRHDDGQTFGPEGNNA